MAGGWWDGGIAVTALIGRGGAGKTRLALEVLGKLPEGWQGGFLGAEEARRFADQTNLADWSWQKPTLIVVDYAAILGPTLGRWFRELADHEEAEHPPRPSLQSQRRFGFAVRSLLSPLIAFSSISPVPSIIRQTSN